MRLTNPSDEFSRQWRKRMIDETCRYIEWGLEHPDKVEWIPTQPVGRGGFSERIKFVYWTLVAQSNSGPDES